MRQIRTIVQIIFTIFTNGYAYGYLHGKIYQGKLKYACVPGLNCYSCPGAVASCPLGALQALLNRRGFQVPFAMLGFFFVFGSIFGRFICGWLCPFGLVQDLLHKIPVLRKRKRLPFPPYPEIRQICGAGLPGGHGLPVPVRRLRQGAGFLQVPMPLRHPVRRLAPDGFQ